MGALTRGGNALPDTAARQASTPSMPIVYGHCEIVADVAQRPDRPALIVPSP
jgi:hypothetical protein